MIRRLSKLEAPSQIGILAYKIVHDVRGPLGAVNGFIQIMQEQKTLDPELREDCVLMSGELARISNLLTKMISYCKPGQSAREVLCPVYVMETMISIVSFLPDARRVQFNTDFPPRDSLRVLACREELQQVFFNIIRNALEALEHITGPRTIGLKIGRSGTGVAIEIQDSGPGIPQEVSAKLGREMVSSKKEGGGVGLLIAKEIAESHKGSLTLQSRAGEGTCVTIRLPVHLSKEEVHA